MLIGAGLTLHLQALLCMTSYSLQIRNDAEAPDIGLCAGVLVIRVITITNTITSRDIASQMLVDNHRSALRGSLAY